MSERPELALVPSPQEGGADATGAATVETAATETTTVAETAAVEAKATETTTAAAETAPVVVEATPTPEVQEVREETHAGVDYLVTLQKLQKADEAAKQALRAAEEAKKKAEREAQSQKLLTEYRQLAKKVNQAESLLDSMLPQTRENALTVMGKDLDADREKLDGLRTNPLIRDVIAQEEVKQRVVEINETKQDILAAQNNIQLADCLVKAIDAGMLEAVLDESTGRYKFGTVKFVNAKNPVVRAALENLKKAFFEQLEAIKDSRTAKTPGAGSLKASVAERTNGNGNGHKNGKVK